MATVNCKASHTFSTSALLAASRGRGGAKARPARHTCCRAVSTETVVPAPSYVLPGALLGISALSIAADNKVLAGIAGILGAFLAVQASRVKFKFEADALEVVIGEEQDKSENAFVGGENRWKYDTFVNWEFWWPGFPVLVYFKETQTKPEGQIHFFPIIFDGGTLYEVMKERCGPSQNSV